MKLGISLLFVLIPLCLCSGKSPGDPPTGVAAVDLGLPSGTKWANINVGATNPEDNGSYFSWGEITTKSDYKWGSYKYFQNQGKARFLKYNTLPDYGDVDDKVELELSDDAASQSWGGKWHIPSIEDFEELISNCTCVWSSLNGKKGYKITSKKNGKSIFLPAAGGMSGSSLGLADSWGCYWSSSLTVDLVGRAYYLEFRSSEITANADYRFMGFPIRPVMK